LLSLLGCAGETKAPGPVTMNDEELERWEIALVEMRIEKNEALMDTSQTSLPLTDVPTFEGLNYYYPDPALRYRVPLQKASQSDTVVLTKRRGEEVRFLRKGSVAFHAEGQNHTLAVFGPADSEEGDFLWLPFYDPTNGEETYPGGRYLDLELAVDGTVELDFNYAYNPLCDYNPERYNCTLPPPENTLPFPVRVGEKLYRLEE
jgi:uncharacterized protein (DUF1684 family)